MYICLDSFSPVDFTKSLCAKDSVCCIEKVSTEDPFKVGGKTYRNSSTWTDRFYSQSGQITSIRMWFSSKIEAIQLKYGDVWANRHGVEKGKQIKYDLDSNTSIISAQVMYYEKGYVYPSLARFS